MKRLLLFLSLFVACVPSLRGNQSAGTGSVSIEKLKSAAPTSVPPTTEADKCTPESVRRSDTPQWKRADKDINGDGTLERVIADVRLCKDDNCYWNVIGSGCKLIGVIEGKYLSVESQPLVVRAYWMFAGSNRALLNSYHWVSGKLILRDVQQCEKFGTSFQCAPEKRP